MSSEGTIQRWPVRFRDHKNICAKYLYDVDGHILVNEDNKILNVNTPRLQDAFHTGMVRLFRNSTQHNITYRYFVTSKQQLLSFWEQRKYGSPEGPNKCFHVYVDDDVDRSTEEYKRTFSLSREEDFSLMSQ